MSDQTSERQPATETADLYHRHEPDPEKWEEEEAVTGRTPDTPQRGIDTPAVANSTFAARAKAAKTAAAKQVDAEAAENKAVTSASTKGATRGATRSRRARK